MNPQTPQSDSSSPTPQPWQPSQEPLPTPVELQVPEQGPSQQVAPTTATDGNNLQTVPQPDGAQVNGPIVVPGMIAQQGSVQNATGSNEGSPTFTDTNPALQAPVTANPIASQSSSTAGSVPQQPPAGNAVPSPIYGVNAASAIQHSQSVKRKKIVKFSIIAAIAVVVAVAAYFIVSRVISGGLKLEKKSNTGYSILIPEGYEEKNEQGMTFYEEKEGDEDTHSAILIFNEAYPKGKAPTAEEKETVLKALENLPKTVFASLGKKSNDFKVERTTYKGKDAVKFSGRVEDDDKQAGDVKGIVVVGDKSFYMIFVAAHDSDPAVAKNMDKIIDSFEITE